MVSAGVPVTGLITCQPGRVRRLPAGRRCGLVAAVSWLLALLIAFNTTSIGVDKRASEHATKLAFGLPVRTVLGMTTVETVLVGGGTVAGVLGGYALLRWLTVTTIPSVLPEIGVTAALSPATIAGAIVLGVLTVAIAPLHTLRRIGGTRLGSRWVSSVPMAQSECAVGRAAGLGAGLVS